MISGYWDLKKLVRGGKAGFEPTQLCGSKLKLHLSPFALGPNKLSFLPPPPSVRLSTVKLNDTHLSTSQKLVFVLRIVSSNIKSHVLVFTTNDGAAIVVF